MILPSQPKTRCLKTPCIVFGGGERVRTDDLLRARQALSQLSYTPNGLTRKRNPEPELISSPDLRASNFPATRAWWAWMDLNHRPHAYQACALTELSYRPIGNRAYLILDRL